MAKISDNTYAKRKAKPNVRTCQSCKKRYQLPQADGVAGATRCPHCRTVQR